MHKIVFLDRSTIAPQIRLRRPRFDHELIEHGQTRPEEVIDRLAGATVVIVNKVPLSDDALRELPGLRLIAVAATGTDWVDKAYCRQNGIAIANVRGHAIKTVPEHAFALILALRRLRRRLRGAAAIRQPFDAGCPTGQRHPDAPGRLGFERGSAGARRPVDQQHLELRRRPSE